MTESSLTLHSRFLGALLGLAAGDALGFPLRGRSREFARTQLASVLEGPRAHESGFFPRGQFSDDTQTALAVAAGLVEARRLDRQTIAEHLFPLWRDQRVVEPPAGTSRAVLDLFEGRVPIESSGQPDGALQADALSRAVVIGLWCHGEPAATAAAAGACASITHQDPRVHAAAAGVAAAVSENLDAEQVVLGPLLERVAEAAGAFHGETAEWVRDFPRLLSNTEYRVFEHVAAFVAEQTDERPREFREGVPDNVLFVFLMSLYYFLKSPFDSAAALRLAFAAGGETTSTCALVGALGGALLGEAGVPESLSASVHDVASVRATVDALFSAIEALRSGAAAADTW